MKCTYCKKIIPRTERIQITYYPKKKRQRVCCAKCIKKNKRARKDFGVD